MVKTINCHVTGESEGDCSWRGSRRSVGSSFHRQGAAYWKERLVIFKEDRVGGRARVTIDEERVLRQGWTEIKLWRYWGWFVVRTLYVRERSLYLIRSFILSQCRDLKTEHFSGNWGLKWRLNFALLTPYKIRQGQKDVWVSFFCARGPMTQLLIHFFRDTASPRTPLAPPLRDR